MGSTTIFMRDSSTTRAKLHPRYARPIKLAIFAFILMSVTFNLLSVLPYAQFYAADVGALGVGGWLARIASNCLALLIAITLGLFLYFKSGDDVVILMTSLVFIITIGNIAMPSIYVGLIHPVFRLLSGVIFIWGAPIVYVWLLIFPDGTPRPRRALWATPLIFVIEIVRALIFYVLPNDQRGIGFLVFFLTLSFVCFGVVTQFHRYRVMASASQRQQIKWVIFGMVVSMSDTLIGNAIRTFARLVNDPTLFVASDLIGIGLTLIGVTIFMFSVLFAVMRRRLWNVDLTVNRSLVAGAVTLTLAAVFIAVLFITQRIMNTFLSGGASAVAFSLAALAVGALFNPTRVRVRRFVDRRLYGLRFDLNQLQRGQHNPDVENPGELTGKVVGGYELRGVVGRGGMGEVYKGYAPDGRIAAVKVARISVRDNPDTRQRFAREGLVTVKHPNIVETYGYGESNGLYYVAMEYVEGKTLRAMLYEKKRLAVEDIVPALQGFADGLDTAHQQGYVHRDIKPANIILRLKPDNETYDALLMDFGIAKLAINTGASLTGSGAVGTIDYMSPEQIMSARTVDHRTDIYALGVVMYETLTGVKPFPGQAGQVLFAHIEQPAPDARDIMPDLPASAAQALLKAMAKAPEDRFASAGEFAAAMM